MGAMSELHRQQQEIEELVRETALDLLHALQHAERALIEMRDRCGWHFRTELELVQEAIARAEGRR